MLLHVRGSLRELVEEMNKREEDVLLGQIVAQLQVSKHRSFVLDFILGESKA